MKTPANKAELIALLNLTEKRLQDLVERKLPRVIPGVSATLPAPTKPIPKETSLTNKEE